MGLAAGTSSLRVQQSDELDNIRAAFERHNLTYNPAIFERAILIPEDKSSSECAKHLPIAGSKLLENPLLATKLKLMKVRNRRQGLDGSGKKRKTKKGAKKGGKKSKKKKAK
ncbi:hypothetical protein AaE_005929 [Aphanomyces astaci]|uniref:Uncharacterized protein n=1 Tax=Aphanomyces astaci TaxID=112090 RepID=A0A6A5AE99_APHAT|nr:hypothetical protein AaE_005929 [Aphanomyces astaci]